MAKKAKKKENSVTRSLYYYDFIWNVYDDNRNRYTPIKRQDERFTHFLEKFHFSKIRTIFLYFSKKCIPKGKSLPEYGSAA